MDFGKKQKRDRDSRTDKGCYPSITLNDSGIVVEVNHQQATNLMFYRVGERKDGCIKWGRKDSDKPPRKRYYGSGAYPQVSLNNENIMIEVHKGQFLDRCYYRLGKVNTESMKVTWGSKTFFNIGIYPDIALNNNDIIVALFQNNIFTKQLHYRVGKVSQDRNKVVWVDRKQRAGIVAEAFSLDINDNGMVLASFQTPIKNHIHYKVGVVDVERGVIEWCQVIHRSVGFTPCVSINNQNQVLQIHQSLMKRHLVSNVGMARWSVDAKGFRGIDWSSEKEGLNHHYGKGLYPSVTLNNHGKAVEVHEPRFAPNRNRLYYYAGEIKQ